MKDQQGSNRNISSGTIAALSAAVVAVSGGVAWLTSQSGNPPTPINPSQSIKQPAQQGSNTRPGVEQTANIYWLRSNEKNLELVPQPVKIAAAQPQQALENIFQTLLAGPTEGTNSTTIPNGTKLLGLKMENNEIHVNLSEDFTSGGGSSSMMGRVGQIVYTATTFNPKAKVYIEVNGQPIQVLGGEGVEIQQPMTRDSFQANYPL
ncbi:GerMN domain-containing protein [Cronbergia sp. UHCC 0137]|uniref:GerMN domain-containing protein n=1 Tax=Cronbergia sp. UHCC 0137 TaxID=3110239 RepID=UPI002B21B21F|nr:GerMN domain-containing protein [Cronbergia sp. UHCC 0137]MEA5618927.1 GerMN domain-containing protein [Cronbergia sp. UHCC 0137]